MRMYVSISEGLNKNFQINFLIGKDGDVYERYSLPRKDFLNKKNEISKIKVNRWIRNYLENSKLKIIYE